MRLKRLDPPDEAWFSKIWSVATTWRTMTLDLFPFGTFVHFRLLDWPFSASEQRKKRSCCSISTSILALWLGVDVGWTVTLSLSFFWWPRIQFFFCCRFGWIKVSDGSETPRRQRYRAPVSSVVWYQGQLHGAGAAGFTSSGLVSGLVMDSLLQYEHTILLRPTCKEVISRGDDY